MPTISGVSGSLAHGNAITINGSDFGTKSPATPHWWDDFEGHSVGAAVSGLTPVYGPNNWFADNFPGTFHAPVIGNSNLRHSRKTRCAVLDDDPVEGNHTIRIDAEIDPLSSGDKLYLFFRQRMEKSGSYSDNWKPYLVSNSGYSNYFYVGYGDPSTDPKLRTDWNDQDGWTDAPGILDDQGIDQTDCLNAWVGYEEEVGLSSSGGSRKLYTHLASSIRLSWNDQAMVQTIDAGDSVVHVNIGEYHRNYNYLFRVDEVYIDNTFARVMLGDNATFGSCTKREILIPTSWGATQITATLRLGVFGDTDTAYLFVVKSDGSVSSGFQVTLGSGGGGGSDLDPVRSLHEGEFLTTLEPQTNRRVISKW